MRFVDQPVTVELHLNPDGRPTPRALTWAGQRVAITDLGRQWEEKKDGGIARHYLIATAGGNRFELVHHVDAGCWRVIRTWECDLAT
ncbi:MAG: hypothetical protein ACOYZ7_19040 [Chloroflexota bacterium]